MYHFEDTNEDLPYSLYVSSKVKKDQKAPLIVTLHGLGAPQTIMMSKTAIDLAEEGGYILVAPMGYNTSGWYGSPGVGGGGGRAGRGKGAAPALRAAVRLRAGRQSAREPDRAQRKGRYERARDGSQGIQRR